MSVFSYVINFCLNLVNTPINLFGFTITPLGFWLTLFIVGFIIYVVRKVFDI